MDSPQNTPPTRLVADGDQYIALAPGALSYLVRHSFRERIFEFKEPYANELLDFGGTLADIVKSACAAGWFTPAPAVDIVKHWARVADFKAALVAKGLPTQGKREELQAACLEHCTEWVEVFAAAKPAYNPTDKGRIELQMTRPEFVPVTRESHLSLMREFFDRDLNDARQSSHILGIKIWPRDEGYWADQPCPRAAGFAGVYLPDEVPELYPDDCPDEMSCSCLNREMVLAIDNSEAGRILREKMEKRGMPPPRQPWDYEKELAEVEQMERDNAARQGMQKPTPMKQSILKRIFGFLFG